MARLVYSSGPTGRSNPRAASCPTCGSEPCRCSPIEVLPPESHAVRVRRERSGRKGKTVTVAAPLFVARDDALSMLKDLKRRCGSGGALKESSTPEGRPCFALEVQGDHVTAVTDRMIERGYPAKRAGG
jgi:translation initiation factor 1